MNKWTKCIIFLDQDFSQTGYTSYAHSTVKDKCMQGSVELRFISIRPEG